ncbi:hypothetical protein [Rhizobium sp. BK251]|uniref:hypothetical protein n=1 Tax=Rhizobium sp. BK251 TaxID=2512125 RepID=UPI001045523E|nr:hypothetical protein [Rhizobium sp. BK251]TCL65106.1 hypothetical protein EV286_1131 [Rhizobium sp. BK251]
MTKPIAPYHHSFYDGYRGHALDPEDYSLDDLPEDLRTAIVEGCHPNRKVGVVLNSTALFAVLIRLVDLDWTDGALDALMTSEHSIARLSCHQKARWRQAMISQARTRYAITKSELKCSMVKVPGTGIVSGGTVIPPRYVRDNTKQPYPWFDNVRYLLFNNLGVERIRHDMACGEIVIDHDHSVLSVKRIEELTPLPN